MKVDARNMAAGLLLVAFAMFFLLTATATLPMGSTFRMGPGYLPVALSILLAAIGVAVMAGSLGRPSKPFGALSWRGGVLTIAAIVSFGLTVPRLGLIPAMLIAVLLSAFASRRMTIGLALSLACGLTFFCSLLFRYALELPVPLLGPS